MNVEDTIKKQKFFIMKNDLLKQAKARIETIALKIAEVDTLNSCTWNEHNFGSRQPKEELLRYLRRIERYTEDITFLHSVKDFNSLTNATLFGEYDYSNF